MICGQKVTHTPLIKGTVVYFYFDLEHDCTMAVIQGDDKKFFERPIQQLTIDQGSFTPTENIVIFFFILTAWVFLLSIGWALAAYI